MNEKLPKSPVDAGFFRNPVKLWTFASYLIRIQVSREHFSPHFLNLTMNTPEFRGTQIVPLIKKQTGQANLNGTALKHMLVPVPPLAEQYRIVAKVDELRRCVIGWKRTLLWVMKPAAAC